MFLGECKYVVKEQKIPKYVIDDTEISSDSDQENSDEETSNKESFNEEDSNKEIFDKINYDEENNDITNKTLFIILICIYIYI